VLKKRGIEADDLVPLISDAKLVESIAREVAKNLQIPNEPEDKDKKHLTMLRVKTTLDKSVKEWSMAGKDDEKSSAVPVFLKNVMAPQGALKFAVTTSLSTDVINAMSKAPLTRVKLEWFDSGAHKKETRFKDGSLTEVQVGRQPQSWGEWSVLVCDWATVVCAFTGINTFIASRYLRLFLMASRRDNLLTETIQLEQKYRYCLESIVAGLVQEQSIAYKQALERAMTTLIDNGEGFLQNFYAKVAEIEKHTGMGVTGKGKQGGGKGSAKRRYESRRLSEGIAIQPQPSSSTITEQPMFKTVKFGKGKGSKSIDDKDQKNNNDQVWGFKAILTNLLFQAQA
jgi:hypothetical protein